MVMVVVDSVIKPVIVLVAGAFTEGDEPEGEVKVSEILPVILATSSDFFFLHIVKSNFK